MNETFDSVRAFLEDWGVWSILIALIAKFATGVLVAIQKNEFKWFYLGNIFKTDMVKLATFIIVLAVGRFSGVPEFENEYLQAGGGAVLLTDLVAGVVKNLAHLSTSVSENTPTSLREPARLRLGNPRNKD
jgi:hypothetical protein